MTKFGIYFFGLILNVMSREILKDCTPTIEIVDKHPLRALTNFTLAVGKLDNCSLSIKAPYFSNITRLNFLPSEKFSVYFLQPGDFNITATCGNSVGTYCVKIYPAQLFLKDSVDFLLLPLSLRESINNSPTFIVRKLQSNSKGDPASIVIQIPQKVYLFFNYFFTAYVFADHGFLYYNICSLRFNDLDDENEIFVETSNGVANFSAFVAKCDDFKLKTSCESIKGEENVNVEKLILKFDEQKNLISNTEMFDLTLGIYDGMNNLLNNTNNRYGYYLTLVYSVDGKTRLLRKDHFDHPESGKLTIKGLRVYNFGDIQINITGYVEELNCQLVETNITINVRNSFFIIPTTDSIINRPLYQANLTANIKSLSSSIDLNQYHFSFDLNCQGASITNSIKLPSSTTWALYLSALNKFSCSINASSPSGFEDIYYTAEIIYVFDVNQAVDNSSLCNISFSGGCVNCKPNSCKNNQTECMCIPNSGNSNSPNGCYCYPGYKEAYQICVVDPTTDKTHSCKFVEKCPEIGDSCEVQYNKYSNQKSYTVCRKYCEQWGKYYRNDEVSFTYSQDFMKIIVKFNRLLDATLLTNCDLAFIDLKASLDSRFTCNVIGASTIHLSFPKQFYKKDLILNINPNLVFSTQEPLGYINALKVSSDFVETPRPIESLEIITESKGDCDTARYFAYTRALSADYIYMWRINGNETNTTVPKLEFDPKDNNTIELSIYSQTFDSVTVMSLENYLVYQNKEIRIGFTAGSIAKIKRGAPLELKIMIINNCGYFGEFHYEWDCKSCNSACYNVENRTDLKILNTNDIKSNECDVTVYVSENFTVSHFSGNATVNILIIENEIEIILSRGSGKIAYADFNLDAAITSFVNNSSLVNIEAKCYNGINECLISNGDKLILTKKIHSKSIYSFGIQQSLLKQSEVYTIEIIATVDTRSTSARIDVQVSDLQVDILLPLEKQFINNDKEFLLIPTYVGDLTDSSFQWTIQPSLHLYDLNLYASILILPPNSLDFNIEYSISIEVFSYNRFTKGKGLVYVTRASPPYCKPIEVNRTHNDYSSSSMNTNKRNVKHYCVDQQSNGLLFFQYGFGSDKETTWAIKKSLSFSHRFIVPNTAKFILYRICNEKDICLNGNTTISVQDNPHKEINETTLISQFYNDTQDSHYTPNALISYIGMFNKITYVENISNATRNYFKNELIENSALSTSLDCERLIFLRLQELNESNYDIINSINETYTLYKKNQTQETQRLTTEIVNKTLDIIELALNSSLYQSALNFLHEFKSDVANSLPFQTKYIFEKNITLFAAFIEGPLIHETIDMINSEININSDFLNSSLVYQVIYFRYYNQSMEMIDFSITAVGYLNQSTPILCKTINETSGGLLISERSPDADSCNGINQNLNFTAKIRLFRDIDEKHTYSCVNNAKFDNKTCDSSANSLGFIELSVLEIGEFIIEIIKPKTIRKYFTIILMAAVVVMTIGFCIYLHHADKKGYHVLNNRLMFISVHPFLSVLLPQVPKRRMAAFLLMVASESVLLMFLGLFQLEFTKSNEADINKYNLSFSELEECKTPWALTQLSTTFFYIFYLSTYTSLRIKMCFIYVCLSILMISASMVAYLNYRYQDGRLNLWAKNFVICSTFDLGVMHSVYSLLAVYVLTAKKFNKVHTIAGFVEQSTNR